MSQDLLASTRPEPFLPLPEPPEPVVALRGVTVSYPRARTGPALEDITLAVLPGSLVAVVGPNGAGKTTLFKTILGLLPAARGQVQVLGQAPAAARPAIAYLPQREGVDWSFPLTVADVVAMGRVRQMGWRLRPRPADREAVRVALERVDLWEHRERSIARLSGGQQQRVFLARALAQDARLLLLDEPFNHVDAATRQLLLELLVELGRAGRTVLVALHDLNLARRWFPQMLFLNRRVMAFGPAQEVFHPQVLQKTYLGQVVEWETGGEARALVDSHLVSRLP